MGVEGALAALLLNRGRGIEDNGEFCWTNRPTMKEEK